jgi:transcriptional regulator with XRE-family HTH domain
MRMSTLANSPADELVWSEASLDATTQASSVDMFIGSRVRVKRTSRGMTRQEFSELLDIDCDTLAAHEAGAERINARLLFQIAKLLDVRADYFFRGYTTEDWNAAFECEGRGIQPRRGIIEALRDLDSEVPPSSLWRSDLTDKTPGS